MGKCFIVCSYIAVAAMFPLSLLLCFKVRALPELIYGYFFGRKLTILSFMYLHSLAWYLPSNGTYCPLPDSQLHFNDR